MNKPQRPNVLTVHELHCLQQEEKAQREALTVHEWNRLQHEQPLIITSDKQIDAGCVLVFDARRAWRFMKDSRYSCISVRVIYKQRPAFLFRLKIKKDDLPW